MMYRFLIVFFAMVLGSPIFSQSPGLRNGHRMVYFKPLKGFVLFGGADEEMVKSDTWLYSSNHWQKLTNEGPSPRTFPCLVATENYILLFGGNSVLFGDSTTSAHYLDDTWKFENGKWEKIQSIVHPSARAEASIAYDPIRKKILLFGGRQQGLNWVLGDTWEFDGEKWQELNVIGPTPRSGTAMVFDTNLKEIMLFGGNPVIAKEKGYNGSTFLWDGSQWKSLKLEIPLIFNCCMAYNSISNYILRFGGWDGKKRNNDTWVFRKNVWQKLKLNNYPEARNHSVMDYDPNENAFFLYGGHNGDFVFGDLWKFKNGKWTKISSLIPRMHVANGH